MSINSTLKKSLLKTILTATFLGVSLNLSENPSKENTILKRVEAEIKEEINLKEINKRVWENVAEYDAFVRSTVNKYYASDVKEMYSFYNIKRDLPKYGFKVKKNGISRSDMDGAVYKESSDSIYFYSTCSEELFNMSMENLRKYKENIVEYFTNRIHHSIKHEAGHAYYYQLGKELGEESLFKTKREDNTPILYDIQHNLVEEGVADYISYKGELTKVARRLSDKDFTEMIEKENIISLYALGFILVKPILDKNFKKGIEELIKNPLTRKDLNDLPGYREKILKKLEE
jgi:hypothetical protein